MAETSNAVYLMSGGGTPVISASAYGLIKHTYNDYRSKIGTFYAGIGGARGIIQEDMTDVFGWIKSRPDEELAINRISFPSWPVFGTSRHKPDDRDCRRMLEVFAKHGIKYVFFNGGNDSMEKAIIISNYAAQNGQELYVFGIPKTVDNDLLETHRCPGYASFAKQVALYTMGLDGDVNSFRIRDGAVRKGPIKEGAIAQLLVTMGRDQGWGAAASVIGKYDDSCAPHVVLTKEGGFDSNMFIAKCQEAWNKYGKLVVVSSEGAHDGKQYLGSYLDLSITGYETTFRKHKDSHDNASVTDSRLALFLKMLIEDNVAVDGVAFSKLKCREEGPGYRNRNDLIILSEPDFRDAVAVGEAAADLAFGTGTPQSGHMVTLLEGAGKTGNVPFYKVADPAKGSKEMVKSMDVLSLPGRPIIGNDGMTIDRGLFLDYIGDYIDLDGPNRPDLLKGRGFSLSASLDIDWKLVEKKLPPYTK